MIDNNGFKSLSLPIKIQSRVSQRELAFTNFAIERCPRPSALPRIIEPVVTIALAAPGAACRRPAARCRCFVYTSRISCASVLIQAIRCRLEKGGPNAGPECGNLAKFAERLADPWRALPMPLRVRAPLGYWDALCQGIASNF